MSSISKTVENFFIDPQTKETTGKGMALAITAIFISVIVMGIGTHLIQSNMNSGSPTIACGLYLFAASTTLALFLAIKEPKKNEGYELIPESPGVEDGHDQVEMQ